MVLMSRDKKAWCYEKWCDGYSAEEIGEAAGCSGAYIKEMFRKMGLKKVRRPLKQWHMESRHLSQSQCNWILDCWCHGYTYRELTEATDLGSGTIAKIVAGKRRTREPIKYEF